MTRSGTGPGRTSQLSAGLAAPGEPARQPMAAMLDGFVACRTTLDDLQQRIVVLGQHLRIGDIALHLTGKAQLPDVTHNLLARAINDRLAEVAKDTSVPYRR